MKRPISILGNFRKTVLAAVAATVFFPAIVNASPTIINVRTDNVSLVLKAGDDGRLVTVHFGGAIEDASGFADFRSEIGWDQGSPMSAYPTLGWKNIHEPALSVVHRNGDLNTDLKYLSHETRTMQDGNVTETVVHLSDAEVGTDVDLVYTAYGKQDVIMSHSVIRNNEKGEVSLGNYYSSALPIKAGKYLLTHLHGVWGNECQVEHTLLTHGSKSVEARTGVRNSHMQNPAFMVSLDTDTYDENAGEVIAGVLAWSGNYKLNFEINEYNVLNILAGINPYAGTYRLGKGESFTTPEMVWTFSSHGAGQASRNLHRWTRDYWAHCGDRLVPPLLNNWEGTGMNFNAKLLTGMIDDAAAMGLEMFVLDDGWFGNKYPRNNDRAGLGDWQVNEAKLPEGIDYIASYAHEKGLKFGLWIEPEMVNPQSELYEKHPDWIVKGVNHDTPTMRNQQVLDLTNPKVQDFVFGVFDSTMQLSDKIDYIKWDANRHIENVGSSYLDSDSQTMFWVKYFQGFYSVMERIRAKYPDVMIQACASGGGRVDYGMLRYFDEVWTSDNTESLTRTRIQYGQSLFYPSNIMGAHVSVVPNHQTGNITPIKFRFDVAGAGRLGLELQTKNMTEDEKAFAKRAIESYKTYRDIIAAGDLYRIGSPYDDAGTYGILYVSEDKSRAVFFSYCIKYQSPTTCPQFKLQGLDLDKNYRIVELNVDKSRSWFSGKTLPGDLLVNKGVNPPIKRLYESAVFLLEAE